MDQGQGLILWQRREFARPRAPLPRPGLASLQLKLHKNPHSALPLNLPDCAALHLRAVFFSLPFPLHEQSIIRC